ncbi:hypothetical protein BV898_20133 [Hypsibius exemplaris]|uniref:Synaptic plasticity regulator PANTS n=1 Tax=Hypsibius exemplaris TaxID=2072580 RepID=A0A1W0XD18_HYPEX|nr:hypothetical protein BV898_20133 [Hypsibius exemplaris]
MIRPCELYKEEYRDCTMVRSRFHQLFTTGVKRDCSQWKTDYENCLLWRKNADPEAAKKAIQSESRRVAYRIATVMDNEIWQLRDTPPENWNAPLPEALERLRQSRQKALAKSATQTDTKVTAERLNPDVEKG